MGSAEPLDRRSLGIGVVGDPLCDTNRISAAREGADNPNPNGMEHENQTSSLATFLTSHHVTPLIRLIGSPDRQRETRIFNRRELDHVTTRQRF